MQSWVERHLVRVVLGQQCMRGRLGTHGLAAADSTGSGSGAAGGGAGVPVVVHAVQQVRPALVQRCT